MSEFDEYFTDNDKPFAENLNDALLLSNVFDFTVPISMPTMFSNGQWVNTTSSRKCSVSLVTIEDLDSLSVTGANIQGTGTLVLKFYPNFNSFGKITKLEWTGDVTECWITDKNNVTVEVEVENGVVLSGNANQLAEYLIHLKINGTLSDLVVTCENKRHRFGATVGVSGVTGLESRLSNIEAKNTQQDTNINNKVDKVTGKGLSSNDYTNAEKSKLANLSTIATSGSYNDLGDKPTIPSKTSDLVNDGDGTNVFVKNNDSRLSDTRNPKTHTHGNISNTGAIGTSSGKLITTGTNGVLQAVDSITKSKISDFPTTMTPSSHTHTIANVTNLQSSLDSKASSGHSHGSISNTGTLNSDITTVNKVAVTDTSNNLKTISKVPFNNLNITKSNITGLGIPSTNTTYSVATANANGLMSSTDKSKLDGISTGATKNTIDTALSSTSTNAVQNKVINTALNGKANSIHSHGYIDSEGKINTILPASEEFEYVLVQEERGGTILSHNRLSKKLMGLDWKSVELTNMSGVSLRYNDLFCSLIVAGSYKISTANSYANMVTGTIPAAYRPSNARVELNRGDVLIRIKLTDDGHLQYYSPQTFTSNVGLYAEFIWSR